MTLSSYRTAMHNQHEYTNRAQENRCRSTFTLAEFTKTPLSVVGSFWRPVHLAYAKARHQRAQARSSACLPTSPVAIIRYVFPASTEEAAVRVAYCESRLYTYARNPSGASGLFQLMPFWWSGKFNPFDPWANTRAAYSISSGGTNWGAWVCQP